MSRQRLRLLLALAVALATLAFGLANRQSLFNLLHGPFPADSRTLETLADHDVRYVSVRDHRAEPIFIRAFTLGRKRSYSQYAWLHVEGKWLLARVRGDDAPWYVGVVQPATAYEQKYMIGPKQAELGAVVLPLCLDAVRPFVLGTVLLVVLPLVALVGATVVLLIQACQGKKENAPLRGETERGGEEEESQDGVRDYHLSSRCFQ